MGCLSFWLTRIFRPQLIRYVIVSIPFKISSILLGGSWELVTTFDWAYNPTYTWGNLYQTSWVDCKWGLQAQLKVVTKSHESQSIL